METLHEQFQCTQRLPYDERCFTNCLAIGIYDDSVTFLFKLNTWSSFYSQPDRPAFDTLI